MPRLIDYVFENRQVANPDGTFAGRVMGPIHRRETHTVRGWGRLTGCYEFTRTVARANTIEVSIPKGFHYYMSKLVVEMVVQPNGDGPALMHLIGGRNVPLSMRLRKKDDAWILSCGVHCRHRSDGVRKTEWVFADTGAFIPSDRVSRIGMAFNGESLMLLLNDRPMVQRVLGIANLATDYNASQELVIGSAAPRNFVGKLLGLRISEMPQTVEGYFSASKGYHATIGTYNTLPDSWVNALGSRQTKEPEEYLDGWVWRFAEGAIYWSEETGAYSVMGAAHRIYKQEKYSEVLGFPCGDNVQTGGLSTQRFERGAIYYSPYVRGGASLLWDEVYNAYMTLGGPSGFLGIPIGLPQGTDSNPRVYTVFQHGRIYWSPGSGAFEVHGRILNRYLALNGPDGILGFPVSNECPVFDENKNEIGRMSVFENGVIYWSTATDAWEMTGPILEKYKASGGPSGTLGFPVTRTYNTSNNKGQCSSCENGVIWWSGDTKDEVRVISELRFTLVKAEHNPKWPFSDEWFSQAPNLYSFVQNTATPLSALPVQFPKEVEGTTEKIEYGDRFVWDIPIRHDTEFKLFVQFWDRDQYDGPDPLGHLEVLFNVNNGWGLDHDGGKWDETPLTGKTSFVESTEAIRTTFKMDLLDELVPITASNFRERAFWHFKNPKTPSIKPEQYSLAFEDVAPGLDALGWAKELYYTALIQPSAKDGSCFGCSLEALTALLGTSPLPAPISQWTESAAKDTINRAHIRQFGTPLISHMFHLLTSDPIREPKSVFDAASQQIDQFGACVVNVFNTVDFVGHSVLAYKAEKKPSNDVYGTLYVANPNHPWPLHPSADVIEIKEDNTWAGPERGYRCSEWGSHLVPSALLTFCPLHVLSIPPWTPVAELFWFAVGALLIVLGNVDTKQLSVGSDEMFDQGRIAYKGIPNMTIIPASTDAGVPFIVAGKERVDGEMRIEITGNEDGKYQASFMSPRSTVYLTSPIKAAKEDTVTLSGTGGTTSKVTVKTAQDKVSQVRLEIFDSLVTRDGIQFCLDLPLASNQEAEIQVEPLSGELLVSGIRPGNQIDAEVGQVISGSSGSARVQGFPSPSVGEVVRVRLIDRSTLDSPVMVERLSDAGVVQERRVYE